MVDDGDSEEQKMLGKLSYQISDEISKDLRLQMQAEILMEELCSNSL